jgi:hypothetical protein
VLLLPLPAVGVRLLRSYRLFTLEQGGAASCMRALLAAAERQNISGRYVQDARPHFDCISRQT